MKYFFNIETGIYIGFSGDNSETPEGCDFTFEPINNGFLINKRENEAWVESATQEDRAAVAGELLALHYCYPELTGHDYKLLNLDNLQDIWRDTALADKGLKGEKKYYREDTLVWSTQKKYWFELDAPYQEGFVRTIKLFKMNGEVADSWSVKVKLTDDDK
ncbi:MAG: hypothetical protein ACK4ON_09860, partial [Bacteroidia bacterium]